MRPGQFSKKVSNLSCVSNVNSNGGEEIKVRELQRGRGTKYQSRGIDGVQSFLCIPHRNWAYRGETNHHFPCPRFPTFPYTSPLANSEFYTKPNKISKQTIVLLLKRGCFDTELYMSNLCLRHRQEIQFKMT